MNQTEAGDNQSDGVADEVVAALRRVSRAIDLHSRSMVQRYGLTGPQWTVLRHLKVRPDQSAGGLAQAVHLSQATVTGILDRLEDRGLVRRQRAGDDRRRLIVSLTDDGLAALTRMPPGFHDRFNSEFRKLADWERSMILASLQRLVKLLDRGDLEPAAGTAPAIPVTPAPAPAAVMTALTTTETVLDEP